MHVMLLTWEYPPKRLGTISDRVFSLSKELVSLGHEVYVITEDEWKPGYGKLEGVHVHRVYNPVKTHHEASVLTTVMTASIRMEQEAANVIYLCRLREEKSILIHAHEWLTIPPSISLRRAFNIPLVLTLHSLEGHRCNDSFRPLNMAIREVEEMGVKESTRIVTDTEWMKSEILRYYGEESENKIDVALQGKDWVNTLIKSYNRAVKS